MSREEGSALTQLNAALTTDPMPIHFEEGASMGLLQTREDMAQVQC